MSALDLIGEIRPWPTMNAPLPEGWSWGLTPSIAQVKAHKSRQILQADALANLISPDVADLTLMRALYRGAAEWELWLLSQDTSASVDAKERCAHSALSLAELSGDFALVEQVLTQWLTVGPSHKRFYRDGKKRLDARSPSFTREVARLRPAVDALVDRRDREAAELVLRATANFVTEGGRGEWLSLRALAMEVLDYSGAEVVRTRFETCVQSPTSPHAICAYMLSTARLTPNDPLPNALHDGLQWFRTNLNVQAIALSLRSTSDNDAVFGETIAEHLARVTELAQSSNIVSDVDFAIFHCVSHIAKDRSRTPDALSLLDATLHRLPSAPTLRVFRALIAHELAREDAFADLSKMLLERPSPRVADWLWRVAGEVFLRGQLWSHAADAFRRGGVESREFSDVAWLNQHAVALARSGKPELARNALERAASLEPEEAIVRHNLEVLRGELDDTLTPVAIDPFSVARVLRSQDHREYAVAA